ncbi:TetR/AcrR family transcriptional regulator [Actinocorallia sp. A-T 12471]|uniref:TetR/AcrR family transcriptional regulator n=1 Tax=Actinocorallia sp. A-T 12471 TaxID=3089813 RepID=UPI0029D30C05|nr:TetR/AcrR family transcriptional regulator [Actinocorallia sp. A-T 12471]MDX6744105.1 TetR/AcrR family transcriptional regulator [Actinocorallia sp. A-T 12471]
MGDGGRGEQQARTRRRVLEAARAEFLAEGFRGATVDGIAERAGLTRGAVYSGFAGKRALYFEVLALDAEAAVLRGPVSEPVVAGAADPVKALTEFARAWTGRLPLALDDPEAAARLGREVVSEIAVDEYARSAYAGLMALDALLLGLALERIDPSRTFGGRRVRVAENALTLLRGAEALAAAAPGFGEPFDVVRACGAMARDEPEERWDPPHLPYVGKARPVDEVWTPPPALDAVRGVPAPLAADGVVAVLGMRHLGAIEEAVRATPDGTVTVVPVSAEPREFGPLARLVVAEAAFCLQAAFPPYALPRLRVAHDPTGEISAAMGLGGAGDDTQAAILVRDGRIVARADGYGACHAAATAR